MENWYESDIELSTGETISIVHNIESEGNINSFQSALDSWLARTDDYTADSFCNYINSKGIHKAMTKQDFLKL